MTDQTKQQVVDVTEFARLGNTFTGEINVADLLRLQDLIVAGPESLHYEIQGALSVRREARITCTIRGSISLECQRCLRSFAHTVDIRSTLIFVADESQLPAIEEEDESVDYLVAEKALDLLAVVEDEVILSLPLAPRHPMGECEESTGQRTAGEKRLPFAALSKFKLKRS